MISDKPCQIGISTKDGEELILQRRIQVTHNLRNFRQMLNFGVNQFNPPVL
jgi:hypothetical protein